MWYKIAACILLASVISADTITAIPAHSLPSSIPQLTSQTSIPTPTNAASISTIPESFMATPTSSNAWDPLISGASHIIDEINGILHPDLRKRQGNAAVAPPAAVAAATAVTQMPPITTYEMYDGVARVYTQVFVAVPDQWPSPSAGAVGLGTIQGEVGVVKTQSKRGLVMLPGPTATAGQTLRIRGRPVTMG